MQTSLSLHLYKQNFKFSAAHFLIFDDLKAEKLHGHNYRVRVDLGFDQSQLNSFGYLVDFNVFKDKIRQKLEQWDERVLLPGKNPALKIQEFPNQAQKSLQVVFQDRFYVFPENEVVILPFENASVEKLSSHLATDFFQQFKPMGIRSLRVKVEDQT